jgi:FMN phosphatase YigB (HAD superfamily)
VRIPGAVFLDFDGVICDSARECMLASARACYDMRGKVMPPHLAPRRLEDFLRLRPFVRRGEDFLLIHEFIDEGLAIETQADFDAAAARSDPARLARLSDLFLAGRKALIEEDREAWPTLNTIYPEARAALELGRDRALYILSTKRPEFILEILGHAGLHVPAEKVLYPGHAPKLPVAERVRAEGGWERAVFIDDQLDFLVDNPYPRIQVYLAGWSYITSEEPARAANVPVLPAADLPRLVAESLGDDAMHGRGPRVQ